MFCWPKFKQLKANKNNYRIQLSKYNVRVIYYRLGGMNTLPNDQNILKTKLKRPNPSWTTGSHKFDKVSWGIVMCNSMVSDQLNDFPLLNARIQFSCTSHASFPSLCSSSEEFVFSVSIVFNFSNWKLVGLESSHKVSLPSLFKAPIKNCHRNEYIHVVLFHLGNKISSIILHQ